MSGKHRGLPRLYDYATNKYEFPPNTQVIISDEIQEGIDNRPDRNWTAADFPNVSPVFDSFFIESHIIPPAEFSGMVFRGVKVGQFWHGLHFLNRTQYYLDKYKEQKLNPPPMIRWILEVRAYMKIDTMPVMHYPGFALIFVGERGELLTSLDRVDIYQSIDETPRLGEHVFREQLLEMIPAALTALALMNSETIVLQPHEGNQKPPKDARYRTGKPGVRFYTLNIMPPRIRRKSLYASPTDGSRPARAAHFRHGKWKSYSGEPGHMFMNRYSRPMSFFVPGHAVGDRENGEVKKKYNIKTGGKR